MDVLVLGGTVFLGRAVLSEALAAGARVTIFNRGVSGPPPDGVVQVTGDRTARGDLARLAGRGFDVVVDTSGYVPADVTLAGELLAPNVGHYAFVSTINVFPGWPAAEDYHRGGVYAASPDATRADAPDDETSYGWLKAGCEQAVLRAFGAGRCSLLRAGLIVGAHDSRVGRLPWWIDRVARGGEVLVPGSPSDGLAMIDARDLAAFALSAAAGTFEVSGPPGQVTRDELMTICREVTGSEARLCYVDGGWLAGQGVAEWTELPLWAADAPSAFRHDVAAAMRAGLRHRRIRDTVADTWAWQRSVGGGWQPTERTPGLAPAKEASLLRAWRALSPGLRRG